MKRELLVGCGHDRRKMLCLEGSRDWGKLVTLDMNPDVKPDVVHDLEVFPYPFRDGEFDEIHAYEVLEHCGKLGDWKFFFAQFDEFHRIMKPGGLFYGTVPKYDTLGAFGDPGHTRVINDMSLAFLDRWRYGAKNSPMTDYRPYFSCNFEVEVAQYQEGRFLFCMRKK